MARTFLDNILLETAIDRRISDGLINLTNEEHIVIFEEKLTESGKIVQPDIDSIIDGLIKEAGKYPDRQAFNKDGWLVTFPSAEYKRRAIEKGTHYENDPTHGNGGMNLYYKRKGKQARQKVQQTSVASGQQSSDKSDKNASIATDKPVNKPDIDGVSTLPKSTTPVKPTQQHTSQQTVVKNTDDITNQQGKDKEASSIKSEPTKTPVEPEPTYSTGDTTPSSQEVPQITQQNVPSPAQSTDLIISKYKENIQQKSMKFALSKGWIKNPTGDYYDSSGILVAIPSTITGEIVPININQREELLASI